MAYIYPSIKISQMNALCHKSHCYLSKFTAIFITLQEPFILKILWNAFGYQVKPPYQWIFLEVRLSLSCKENREKIEPEWYILTARHSSILFSCSVHFKKGHSILLIPIIHQTYVNSWMMQDVVIIDFLC